jgi:hypothetical protein
MKYMIGLGIKLLLVLTVLMSIFSVVSRELIDEMLFLTVVIVVVSFVLGDLFLVPRIGNIGATIADFGLSFIIILFGVAIFHGMSFVLFLASFLSAFLIATGEAFFHYYVRSAMLDKRREVYVNPRMIDAQLNTQTEFAEENDLSEVNERNEK